jgi:N6-adenosine-specific RNA methylase IME4
MGINWKGMFWITQKRKWRYSKSNVAANAKRHFNALIQYRYQIKGIVINNLKKKGTLLYMQYGGTSKIADQIFFNTLLQYGYQMKWLVIWITQIQYGGKYKMAD